MWQIKLGSTWCHFDWSNKYKLLWKRSSKFIHFVRNWLVTSGLHFRSPLPVLISGLYFPLRTRWQKTTRLFITKQLIKDHERNVQSTSDSEPTKLPKKERKVPSSNLSNYKLFYSYLGIVAAVKGSYGFIKRDKSRIDRKNQESRIFFHSSEILDANSKLGRRRIKMGNEVSLKICIRRRSPGPDRG